MFTEQVGQLDSAKTVDDLKDILKWLLGNCEASLTHRGPVTLDGFRPEGATDAMLNVTNGYIAPDDAMSLPDANGDLTNGWAAIFNGGVRFRGPFIGGFRWAKASGNWTNTGTAAWVSYVDCVLCSDYLGTEDPQGRTIRIYLPRSSTRDPNVRTGDVIQYTLGDDGRAYCATEVYDGKIGEQRDLLSGTAADYASGLRGWFLADGANGTVDLDGPLIGYGYTGAGDYATVGNSVSASFTATISGNGGTVTTSSATTGVTVSAHTAHTHSIEHESIEAALSSLTATSYAELSDDDAVNTYNRSSGGEGFPQDTGHTHSLVANTSPSTFNTSSDGPTTHTVNDSGHTHTVSIDTMAAGLSIGTPSANRPAGKVVIRIQRVS